MQKTVLQVLLCTAAATSLGAASHAQEAPGFCEAGYVLADENGDGILERGEAETLWGQEFGALDADASGAVSAEEYAACAQQMRSGEVLPRNVSATGSGDLGGSGVQVELEGLADGSLGRQEYMDAALSAFDAAGNEEDNQLEWARVFIVLAPDEAESAFRSFGRDGFAARASALFGRLDSDGDGALTPEEWVGDAGGQTSGESAGADAQDGAGAAFAGLDADASGDVTLIEYSEAGAARFARARDAAIAGGWQDTGDYAAGIGTEEGEGEVVATESTGLAGGDGEAAGNADTTGGDVATAGGAAGDAAAAAGAAGAGAAGAGGDAGAAAGADAGAAAGGDAGAGTSAGAGAAGQSGGGVPVGPYRFGIGN